MFCNIWLILSGILIVNLHVHLSSATTADYTDPCTDYVIIESHYNRTVNYTLKSEDEDVCESSFLPAGWYAYQDFQNIPTKPPVPGQCGSSSPIWLNGSYPTAYGEYRTLKACRVETISNCKDSWDVTVVNCMSYNVAYLEPVSSCGRYCMESKTDYKLSTESNWMYPCYSYNIIPNEYDRTVDYTLMSDEIEICDNITLGWYGYMGYENVPTQPPKPGQCGSSSPIWFNGTYPSYYGMTSTMKACTVGLSSNCSKSWNVTVMNCGYFNVAKLTDLDVCARYCMESKNNSDMYSNSSQWYSGMHTSPLFNNSYNGPSTPSYWNDPCKSYNIIPNDYDRTVHYTLMSDETEICDNITMGWYGYMGYENVPTQPPKPGQCGSSSPIWFNGTYPWYHGMTSTMKACTVGLSSNCSKSWNVTVMNCGYFNVAKLTDLDVCARYCMESKNNSDKNSNSSQWYSGMHTSPLYNTSYNGPSTPSYWNDPCNSYNIIPNDYDRTVHYTLMSGETEICDNITMGWYGYMGYENVPTQPPKPGQCGSSSPIWFNGTYPWYHGMTSTMKACTVGLSSNCSKSWNVTVMNCGYFNVAKLTDLDVCARYCMESKNNSDKNSNSTKWYSGMHTSPLFNNSYNGPSTPLYWNDPCNSYNIIPNDYDRTVHYTLMSDEIEICDNITMGWYGYIGYENVPTQPPKPGQCGSSSPIWFNGTYPLYHGMTSTMKACIVGLSSNCSKSWNVTVMNCGYFNVAKLTDLDVCARYCMESKNDSDKHYNSSQWYSEMYKTTSLFNNSKNGPSTPSYWNDPCNSYNIIPNDYDRTVDYTLMSDETEICDNITMGWYGYIGYENVPTHPPKPGQCGSSSPIWFNGTYPSYQGMTSTMKACIVGLSSNCSKSWNVTVMNCGYFNVAQLTDLDVCARYCMESKNGSDMHSSSPSWYSGMQTPSTKSYNICNTTYVNVIESTADRTFNSTLEGEEICDNITEGWYRYSGNEKIPSRPPIPGQCSSSSPIWVEGTYPSPYNGEVSELKACMVSPSSTCEKSWNVTFMYCNDQLMVYLKPLESCARYCMEDMVFGEKESTTPSFNAGENIDLNSYIGLFVEAEVPTYDTNSEDRQLMFKCTYWQKTDDISFLDDYSFDVKWVIDDDEVIVKSNIKVEDLYTTGRLKSSDWSSRPKKMGFNVKCGGRLHSSDTGASYVESDIFFAGMDVWPKSLSISSGQSAEINVWSTVPVACIDGSSHACDVTIEMVDFNEQFTSGAPAYCNSSITDLTKPSLCGLVLDGWKTPSVWQKLSVSLPANTAQDQEYQAKLLLRVSSASYDSVWTNYLLPEISINVVNENVTDDYWMWYGSCFTGSDPWFSTFDWRWYGFHDEGEFTLYRHKTKPIEINTIQRRRESHHTWTEHCAIAVRAASDVFIIYGCGNPPKWVVRRLGCSIGNEYLEVYSSWGTYEIVLPTGTRVHVWISGNRMLNVYTTLSRADLYETEGLCGTWNGNYDDDFTGRDGNNYQDPTDFARTWSVPESDSLFINKTRTEKMVQSFMYCSCLGQTLAGFSSEVDCSWKESQPVCPPLNMDKKSCTVRNKRSTDNVDEDDVFDISADEIAYIERPEVSMDWKNGWNESSAEDACTNYFSQSVLFDACSSLSNVNTTAAITNCIQNIQLSGTDDYMDDSFELLKTECANEVRTNNTLWKDDEKSAVAQLIDDNVCPFDCKYKGKKHGDCVKKECNCYVGFTGKDCRVNMTAGPDVVKRISDESFCDKSISSCEQISIYGENFYESANLLCRIETANNVNNELISTGTSFTTTGILEGVGEVKCPLTTGSRRRRKRSTETSTLTFQLVSVTNDGVTYSDTVATASYDSSCYTCTTNGTNVVCQLRSDICVVNGGCYSATSSQCSSDSDATTASKIWLVGVVTSVFILGIIVFLVFKWYKKSKSVGPVNRKGDEEQQNAMQFDAYERYPTPNIPLNRKGDEELQNAMQFDAYEIYPTPNVPPSLHKIDKKALYDF